MEDSQKAKLQAKAETGAIMRGFMNHPGFAIWQKDLQDAILDIRNKWLTADTPEKAEKVRNIAIQLNEALDMVKRRVIEGDNASKLLAMAKEEALDENLNQGLHDH